MKSLQIILTIGILATTLLQSKEPKAVSVAFIIQAGGWAFTALPDGSVHGQFGSLPGDSIHFPPNTVNFREIVAFVKSAKPPLPSKTKCQAAIRHKGETSITLKPIAEKGYFKKLFLENQNRWLDWMNLKPDKRLLNLMQRIEYYKEKN